MSSEHCCQLTRSGLRGLLQVLVSAATLALAVGACSSPASHGGLSGARSPGTPKASVSGASAPSPSKPAVTSNATPPAAGSPSAGTPSTAAGHRTPTPWATGGANPADDDRLLLGIGGEADKARATAFGSLPSVRLLTSWYNSPRDFSWMTGIRSRTAPTAYAAGYALQLIVYAGDTGTQQIPTKYGTACGRPYPLSAGFLDDMRKLAAMYGGRASGPPLYVSMFAEFETYKCGNGDWDTDPATAAYYKALIDQYRAAIDIFHAGAPNARVALCWGGWEARYDDPAKVGSKSLISHFADALRASDFQSFQSMSATSNPSDIQGMTRILGRYGPVLMAYYQPGNSAQSTFDADVRTIFTPDYLRGVVADGLLGFAFMNDDNVAAEPATAAFLSQAAAAYGRAPWSSS